MAVAATVVIPTHNHGPTLYASVGSALAQTVPVEVFVMGDGVSDETRAIAQELARRDERVRFFDHPKSPSRGELHRDAALEQARGRVVCYLGDDDVYLPHHVEDMCGLLEDADFVHAQAIEVLLEGGVGLWTVDLARQRYQREVLAGINRVPLSAAAHTLSVYRGLAEGWTTAPPEIPSDLFMWQKFVRHPGCRFRPGRRPSVLVFPSPKRRHLPHEERLLEMQRWIAKTEGAAGLARLDQEVLAAQAAAAARPFTLQVFYPSLEGHNQRDSGSFQLQSGVWEAMRVRFPYPASATSIRIDPLNQPGLIEIERISVRDLSGNLWWELTPENAYQVRVDGTAVAIRRGPPLLAVSDGIDPQIILPPLKLPREPEPVDLELILRLDADAQTLAGLLAERVRAVQSKRVPLRRVIDRLIRRS
jgi:hypothetical protein